MTNEEFFSALEEVRGAFDWKLTPDQGRVPERRRRQRLRIRGSAKERSDGWIFDPIGAVCYARAGKLHVAESWLESARALELSLIDAADLTAAANDVTWWMEEGQRGPEPHLQAVRAHLLAVLGLSTQASGPRIPIMARMWSRWRSRRALETV